MIPSMTVPTVIGLSLLRLKKLLMSKKKRSSTSQLQFIRPDRLLWECVSNSRVTLKINPEFFSPESGTAGF